MPYIYKSFTNNPVPNYSFVNIEDKETFFISDVANTSSLSQSLEYQEDEHYLQLSSSSIEYFDCDISEVISNFQFGIKGFTFETHIKLDSFPNSGVARYIFSSYTASQEDRTLNFAVAGAVKNYGNNNIRFATFMMNNTESDYSTSSNVNTGTWYHVAFQYAYQDSKYWTRTVLNAVAQTQSAANPGNLPYIPKRMSIGRSVTTGALGEDRLFDGCISEIKVFDTSSKISAISGTLNQRINNTSNRWDDLAIHFKCNEGTGSIVYDHRFGNNATLFRGWPGNQDAGSES